MRTSAPSRFPLPVSFALLISLSLALLLATLQQRSSLLTHHSTRSPISHSPTPQATQSSFPSTDTLCICSTSTVRYPRTRLSATLVHPRCSQQQQASAQVSVAR